MKKFSIFIIFSVLSVTLITQSNIVFASHVDENGFVIGHCVDGCDFPIDDSSPSNYNYDDDIFPTLIASFGVIIGVGVTVGAIVKTVKNVKTKRSQNQTKEKTYYDSSKGSMPKGYDDDTTPRLMGDTPMLLRKQEVVTPLKTKPPPPPSQTMEQPLSILEIAEEVAQKWERIKDTNWSEFFSKVGQCIIDNGGRLDTWEAASDKADNILKSYNPLNSFAPSHDSLGNKVGEVNPSDYLEADRSGVLKPVEFGELMKSKLLEKLIDEIPDVGAKTFSKIPIPPIKVLNFLVENFGTNISTSYVCLFYHIKEL